MAGGRIHHQGAGVMRKNTEERFIPAEVTISGRQATLAIDGNRLSISAGETPEESQEAIRKRLVLTAKLRRTTIKATITDPDGGRAILVHPDGAIEDAEKQDDGRENSPAALPPEMQAEPDSKRNTDTGRTIRKAGVALLTVALLAGAGIGIHRMIERGQETARTQAYQTCMQARKDTAKTFGRTLRTEYASALGVTAEQVKDPSTVRALHRLMESIDGRTPLKNCNPQDTKTGLGQATASMRRSIGDREKLHTSVAKSAKAVLASRDAKVLDDAKAALDGKKGEASKLLADSDGKVADNATRDGLQKAIDQADQVRSNKAKAYQDAVNALQAAIDQVNASVQAKSQADQQAAAQAAQAQQAPQQPAQRQGTAQRQPNASQPHGSGRPASPPTSRPAAPQGGWSVPPATSDDNSLPDHL